MPSKKSPYKDIRLPRAKGMSVYLRRNSPADETTEPYSAMEEAEEEMEALAPSFKAASKAYGIAMELHEVLAAWDEPEASVVAYLLPHLQEKYEGWRKLYEDVRLKRARLAEHLGVPHYRPQSEEVDVDD